MKQKMKVKRLESRQKDFADMQKATRHEAKVASRIDNGGFHKPGSFNK